jgi:hypothetical protein
LPLFPVKGKETVNAFFPKLDIHFLFVARLRLHSKPKRVFSPDTATIQ